MTEILAKDSGLRPQDLMINLVETAWENWSFGNGEAHLGRHRAGRGSPGFDTYPRRRTGKIHFGLIKRAKEVLKTGKAKKTGREHPQSRPDFRG